jgi:predicted phage-related endonuclease
MTLLCEATLASLGMRADGVADLSRLGLSAEAIARRRGCIGGSDATIIAGGDDDEVNALARFKMGGAPLDLSERIEAMLGLWTEPFNLAWLERSLGQMVSRRGEVVIDPDCPWRACTLDGWIEDTRSVVQAKHVNGFWKPDALIAFYTAQVHHEMLCTGAREALLSVIFGNHKHLCFRIPFDPLFAGELAEAEAFFWSAVQKGELPRSTPVTPPPPELDVMIEVDMSGVNSYADAAARYIDNRPAVMIFEEAEADHKAAMPANAKRIYGHGVEVTRDKRGARRVKSKE